MKLYHRLFGLCAGLLCSLVYVLYAETSDASKTNTALDGLWMATVAGNPDGAISVPIRMISSVSIHHYLLNGKIPIAELTIDTTGNNSIRLYTVVSPSADAMNLVSIASEAFNGAKDLAGLPSVAKQYPETTHAHSVEYNVSNVDVLKAAYASINKSIATGQGAKVTIR